MFPDVPDKLDDLESGQLDGYDTTTRGLGANDLNTTFQHRTTQKNKDDGSSRSPSSSEDESNGSQLEFDREGYRDRPIVIALGDESATPSVDDEDQDDESDKSKNGSARPPQRGSSTTTAPRPAHEDKTGQWGEGKT